MVSLHPTRDAAWPDYPTERESDFGLWWSLGSPYETARPLRSSTPVRWTATRGCV